MVKKAIKLSDKSELNDLRNTDILYRVSIADSFIVFFGSAFNCLIDQNKVQHVSKLDNKIHKHLN